MYSFGDSTAFPLRENFLDTLTHTVRSCAALFSLECEIEDSEGQTREIHKAVTAELARHESLEVALNLAIGQVPGVANMQTAALLKRTHLDILHRARQALIAERDRLLLAAAPNNLPGRIREVLSTLWLKVELPHTQWSYRWRLDEEGKARTQLNGQLRGMSADFSANAPPESLWSGEIEVGPLCGTLSIQTPVWTRRCKGTETKLEDLAEYSIIEIESSAHRKRLLLRRSGKSKHAVVITLADALQPHPSISLVDEQHAALGPSHRLSLADQESLQKLWSLVHEREGELVDARTSLSNMCLDNRQLASFEHPSEIAEMLLACIAPLVREIRMRSRVPGELILKKNIGEGRREELFLARDTLQALYDHLPDHFRRVFDAMGLGQESTRELVTMLSEEEDRTPLRQRSARVVSSVSQVRPPPMPPAGLAVDEALAELTADDEATIDIGADESDEPSIIVSTDAA